MPKPKDARNPDRAYQYVKQALEHCNTIVPEDVSGTMDGGTLVSLKRNLESALADLAPPKEGA